jgi:hypothetical protein
MTVQNSMEAPPPRPARVDRDSCRTPETQCWQQRRIGGSPSDMDKSETHTSPLPGITRTGRSLCLLRRCHADRWWSLSQGAPCSSPVRDPGVGSVLTVCSEFEAVSDLIPRHTELSPVIGGAQTPDIPGRCSYAQTLEGRPFVWGVGVAALTDKASAFWRRTTRSW